jgi:hypothetical protein
MGLELGAEVFPRCAEIAGGGDSDAGDDSRMGLIDLDPGNSVGRDVNGRGSEGEGEEDGAQKMISPGRALKKKHTSAAISTKTTAVKTVVGI